MTPETLLITINLLIYNKCLINFDWQFQINLIQSQPQVSVFFVSCFMHNMPHRMPVTHTYINFNDFILPRK